MVIYFYTNTLELLFTLTTPSFYVWAISLSISLLLFWSHSDTKERDLTSGTALSMLVLPPALAILVFSLMFAAISAFSVISPQPRKIFAVPLDFVGPVLMIFEQEHGQNAIFMNEQRVYLIPEDGVSFQQGPSPESVGDEFWYVDSSNQLVSKIDFVGSCPTAPIHSKVTVCLMEGDSFIGGQVAPPNWGFIISAGRLQKETEMSNFENWASSILETTIEN